MENMYKEVPDKDLETHKLGSVYFLMSGLATMNTILRHTLLPKSGDHRMIRGHCRCQNRWISGRGSRTMRLKLMVTAGGGQNVYPSLGPLDGGNTLPPDGLILMI